MRDGGQSKEALAGDEAASASRIAARAALLTASMLLVGGCGGSSRPSFRDPGRLALAVRRSLEQGLMTQEPREPSARTPTHVARLRCRHLSGDRYACTGVRGDGSKLSLDIVVSGDGTSFRLVRRTDRSPVR